MIITDRWQQYFAGIAQAVARGSKDPSTQCGAVIYRPDLSLCSTGFNGLPRGIPDLADNLNDRSRKYPRMVHAECNALDYKRESVFGYGMVVTAHPCSVCALRIISNGISVVYYIPGLEKEERWVEDMKLSRQLFREAVIALIPIR